MTGNEHSNADCCMFAWEQMTGNVRISTEELTCAGTKRFWSHTGSDDVYSARHCCGHIAAAVSHIVGDHIGDPIG